MRSQVFSVAAVRQGAASRRVVLRPALLLLTFLMAIPSAVSEEKKMPDFMTQPYGGFSPGLGPMGSRPVRNVKTRNVTNEVFSPRVPLPPPNPMREVQQPTQPVQPQMGVPGDQGYANPALADALLAMSQQGADSPLRRTDKA